METDEAGTISRQKVHRKELIDPKIAEHHGRIVKTTGDGLLVEFASVVDAVQCAVDLQRAMVVREAGTPEDKRIAYRIGINLGDIFIDDDDILGDGVNLAARLEGLAEPGGICVSRTVRNQVRDTLDIAFEDMGEVAVKNIARPVHTFRVVWDSSAQSPADNQPGGTGGIRKWVAVAAAVLLLAGAGLAAWWQPWAQRVEPASVARMAFPLPDEPSIAVLPFDNLIGDPKQNYLGDGLTETIIAALSQIPQMFVIARNSILPYQGNPVAISRVAEDLGVQYVLKGSTQTADDRLRVTVQLVDATTGRHVWSERYDRPVDDLFDVQDEITFQIATELQVALTEGEQARLLNRTTGNLDAWSYAVRGNDRLRRQTEEDTAAAQGLFRQALNLDPSFADAWVRLGWTHLFEARYGWSASPGESMKRAVDAAEKARGFAEQLPDVYGLLSQIHAVQRDYDKAIDAGEQAVALGPSHADAHALLADTMRYVGRWEEAVRLTGKAMRLNPRYPGWYLFIRGNAQYFLRRYDDAIATFQQALERGHSPLLAHSNLAAVYAERNRLDQARTHAAEVFKLVPDASLETTRQWARFKNPTDTERLVDALRSAGFPDRPPLPVPDKPSIAVLPFDNMSGDPEQAYFANGLAEDLITDLSRIAGLFVIARNSSFAYKGRQVDLRTIARELGVKYVLEGSVRRVGETVRINAQLIDAETGGHLWAERYDGELADIFALQDRITSRIVDGLKLHLTNAELTSIATANKVKPEAYDLFLRARELYRTLDVDNYKQSLAFFEQAVNRDPAFADAHAWDGWLAAFVWSRSRFDILPSRQALARAKQSLARALALDPNNVRAHLVDAQLQSFLENHELALAAAAKATALAPNDHDALIGKAQISIAAGEIRAARKAIEAALRANPRPTPPQAVVAGRALYWLGLHGLAVAMLEPAYESLPNSNQVWFPLMATYAELGRMEKAKSLAEHIRMSWPEVNLAFFRVWYAHFRRREDTERYIEAMRQAGVPEWPVGFEGREEDRLNGGDIEKLLRGHRFEGRTHGGKLFVSEYRDDGTWTWRSPSGISLLGRYVVKGDERCVRSPDFMLGREICAAIYHKTVGAETRQEFIYVNIFTVHTIWIAD
ncbi:MAG: tetratricopeptide repeat protein [Alphaproteobacteria bacterium]|nr:tetratricopeptide repeat protein [Alphaproteobacteria bacterium]